MADTDNDLILMTHPELEGAQPATTTRRALRTVWGPRGWEAADEAVVTAGEFLGEPVPDLESLTKAQLLEVAANLDIEGVGQRTSNADIIEAIRDSPAFAGSTEEV